MLSINSSHDSLSENAESKQISMNKYQDTKCSWGHVDNTSCIIKASEANLALVSILECWKLPCLSQTFSRQKIDTIQWRQWKQLKMQTSVGDFILLLLNDKLRFVNTCWRIWSSKLIREMMMEKMLSFMLHDKDPLILQKNISYITHDHKELMLYQPHSSDKPDKSMLLLLYRPLLLIVQPFPVQYIIMWFSCKSTVFWSRACFSASILIPAAERISFTTCTARQC